MQSGKAVVWIIILLIVGLGLYTWSSSSKGGDDAIEDDQMMEENMDTIETDESMMEHEGEAILEGSYEVYAPEKLALADSGDVVLFFRASWCPTCRALDADIRAKIDEIPAGVAILDVDYDNSTALKQKYGVTYQHTLVQVDSDGNQIAKWQGSPTLEALISEVQ